MMLDAQVLFSNKQALTTGTIVSTNVVDLTVLQDLGPGEAIDYEMIVTTTFVGGTSIQMQLITANNAAMTSPTVLQSGPVVLTAALVAGAQVDRQTFPIAGSLAQEFVAVQYVIVGNYTAGNATAGIVQEHQAHDAFYKSGIYTVGV